MNVGKQFEQDFSKSVPDSVLIYRLPDAAQSFGGGNLRFSRKNPFDYIMYDGSTLFALELKTVKGKSISFERMKEDSGDIHYHQIVGLNEWNKYRGTICGFVVNFRDLERTVFIPIHKFNELVENTTKKSLNINDLVGNVIEIGTEKVRTRYRYDIEKFINDAASPPWEG